MILEKIRQLYPQLTKSQKMLADFLATNYREAAFMTASHLARHLRINETTVIRFAQRLDYRGYPELIADIQEIVKAELSAKSLVIDATASKDPFLQILAHEDENLRRAINRFSTEVAHELLAVLKGAESIYLLGQGTATHLAGLLDFGLRAQGMTSKLVCGDVPSLATSLNSVGDADLVIGFCLDDASVEIANALRYARQAGSKTVAFAQSVISPVAQAADLAITCPANDYFVVPSVTVLVAFVDAFLQMLAQENPEKSNQRRERIRRAHKAMTNEISE